MSSKVIRANLITDYTDRTAQDVIDANPNTFFTAGTGDVPLYLYTSLATLLGVSSSELANRVVADKGVGRMESYGGIVVTSSYIPSHMEGGPPEMRSDQAGAETDYATLVVYKTRKATTSDDILNIMMRLIYLLDHQIRSRRSSTSALVPPGLDSTSDITILKTAEGGYYHCHYIGMPPRDEVSASENAILFKAQYVRRLAFK